MVKYRSFVRFYSCLFASILFGTTAQALAADLTWDGLINLDVDRDGLFSDTGNWNEGGAGVASPPTTGDTAIFDANDTYTVFFTQNEVSDLLDLNNGNVTFLSNSATPKTYSLTTGLGRASVDGGSLQVGSVSNPVSLEVADSLDIGTDDDGTVTVVGANSQLNALGPSHFIGSSGFEGSLTVSSDAQASIGTTGSLTVGTGIFGGSEGTVRVRTGGDLFTGNLNIAPLASSSTGTVIVSESGSSITQSLVDATLFIGSFSGGTGTLGVLGSGLFTTGTGAISINETGTVSISSNGTLNANGALTMATGSTLRLSSGATLNANAGLDNSAGGTLDFRDGTLTVIGGAYVPNAGGLYTLDGQFSSDLPHLVLGAGATANLSGTLRVGDLQKAQLSIVDGAEVSNSFSTLGSVIGAIGTVSVSGTDGEGNPSRWSTSDSTFIGSFGMGTLAIDSGAEVTTGDFGVVASVENSHGAVDVSGTDGAGNPSMWSVDGVINVGQGGTGSLAISGGARVSSASTSGSSVGQGVDAVGIATVTGTDGAGLASTWTNVTDLTIGTFGVGTLDILDGGQVSNATAFVGRFGGTGLVTVSGLDVSQQPARWTNSEDLYLGGSDSSAGTGSGTLIVENQGTVEVSGTLKIWNPGTLTLDGGHLVVNSLENSDGGSFNFLAGSLTIYSGLDIGSGDVFPGSLSLAAPQHLITPGTTTIAPFHSLTLAGGSLKTDDLVVDGSFLFTSGLLELTGGSITGLSSLVIPTNGEVRAQGIQSQALTGIAGSTITATGDLTLGDAAKANGFYTNGTLSIGANMVTVADANSAVFDSGSLVELGGEGGSTGDLVAANGITLDFGGNIQGQGTVDTPNDPAKPLINNGSIAGNSGVQPITLTGYVKGVGTLDNVVITGTDAPGFSPATLFRGSVKYAGSLEIEIGGTRESEFDAVHHSGVASLGGVLEVSLIDDYNPQPGDTFEFLTAIGGVQNTFATELLPSLFGGLEMEISYGVNSVELLVTSNLDGDYNNDGVVNLADYTVWRDNLGAAAGTLVNDPNAGMIGTAQYDAWKINFGATLSQSGSLRNSTAPEPSTCFLVTLVALASICRCCRAVS